MCDEYESVCVADVAYIIYGLSDEYEWMSGFHYIIIFWRHIKQRFYESELNTNFSCLK